MNLIDYLKMHGYEGKSVEERLAELDKSAPSLEERFQELGGPSIEERLRVLDSKSGNVRYEWPPYIYHKR